MIETVASIKSNHIGLIAARPSVRPARVTGVSVATPRESTTHDGPFRDPRLESGCKVPLIKRPTSTLAHPKLPPQVQLGTNPQLQGRKNSASSSHSVGRLGSGLWMAALGIA